MKPSEIKDFFDEWQELKNRTIVLVDFANVENWKESLGWKIGVRELGTLVKNFSGQKNLRRFYYGSDYGKSDRSTTLLDWSNYILTTANFNGFEIVTKRTKYVADKKTGDWKKKCDLDLEMFIDLIKMRKTYDKIILFSGDGDLACALQFMREKYKKRCYVFAARDHLGKETADLLGAKKIEKIFFAEDFEKRLEAKIPPRKIRDPLRRAGTRIKSGKSQ